MNKQRKYLLVTIAVLSVILTALCGVAFAKYVESTELPGSITISAKLAESIEVLESKAERQLDGSYKLGDETAENGNSYTLIPGLDVPKDPYVKITGKTSIEAYVFIEVVDDLEEDSGISYEISNNWKLLNDLTGKNGGKVYVYTGGNENAMSIGDNTSGLDRLEIIENNQILVSQKLDKSDANLGDLKFYASIGQVAAGDTPESIYESITTTP